MFNGYSNKSASLFFILSLILAGCSSSNINNNIRVPGDYGSYTLLPNGWKLTPAGNEISIGELPLNMIITKDEKYAITSNSGDGENSLSVIDLEKEKEVQKLNIDKTWRGLCFNADESIVFASGGYNDNIYLFSFSSGKLTLKDSLNLRTNEKEIISVTGVAFCPSNNYVLAVSKENNSLYVFDPGTRKIVKILKMNSECFDVIIDHKMKYAYISLWGSAQVAKINLGSLAVEWLIKVGDHPCEMLISADDKFLYVTNANNNSTSVIDLIKNMEVERIISALRPDAPYGSTPNAACFNEDGTILIVANADNNYLALFDISSPGDTKTLGFIPVGWYPTSVKYLPGHKQIIVANGKGLTSMANPKGPKPGNEAAEDTWQYIGSLFKGTLSIINYPDEKKLSEYSAQVYNNTPYFADTTKRISQSVFPEEHNGIGSSKIKHVFYIIKENRTYDQVLGDISKGNGDSSLCLFPRKVTPNLHKLSEEYTLFDNFYVNAEVSADGHNWSTAAYASDYVEKNWPTYYGGRGGSYDFEGDKEITSPSSGYIWDKVIDKGITFKNYGEFVNNEDSTGISYSPTLKKLQPFTSNTYPGWDLKIKDINRFKVWKQDFDKLVESGSLPAFEIIRLPNDHTSGTSEGYPTINAMVADNDYAVGMVAETISHSKIWKESIIFILEDDAQDGSDHVDAHRSPLYVISPYIKRNFVDHTMYSTSSVLKTIELILGLQPMTQYDLSAMPLVNAVVNTPDLSPYLSVKPNINLEEMNTADLYNSKKCGELNFAIEDAIPDDEFNEIIWKALKGPDSQVPPPVRSAFVKINE